MGGRCKKLYITNLIRLIVFSFGAHMKCEKDNNVVAHVPAGALDAQLKAILRVTIAKQKIESEHCQQSHTLEVLPSLTIE